MTRSRQHTAISVLLGAILGLLPAATARGQCDELAAFVRPDGLRYGDFGWSSALDGKVGIVGTPVLLYQSDREPGSASVLRLEDSIWRHEAILLPSDETPSLFGFAVAVSGDAAVVGAPYHQVSGCAYLFRNDAGSSWIEEAKLSASDGHPGDHFGYAVVLDGNVAIVGAPLHDDGRRWTGAVYVYRFDPQNEEWTEEAKLVSDGLLGYTFGRAVGVDGDILVVGTGTSAHFYRFDPKSESWVQEARVVGPPESAFGKSIAICGTAAVIGAHHDKVNGREIGAAYVYRYDPKTRTWHEEDRLTNEGAAAFGLSVDIGQDLVIVGDYVPGWWVDGYAYVFQHDEQLSRWEQTRRLFSPYYPNDFGTSVAVDEGVAMVGDPGSVRLFGGLHRHERAAAQDLDVIFGEHIAGTLKDISASDDSYVQVRSGVGIVPGEPHVADLVIGLAARPHAPVIDLHVEHHASVAGTLRARLKNWTTGRWEVIAEQATWTTDRGLNVECHFGPQHIRPADGRVELSLRQVVTDLPPGGHFDAFYDHVKLEVR